MRFQPTLSSMESGEAEALRVTVSAEEDVHQYPCPATKFAARTET